jgi:hypothetical protein
LFVYVAGYKLTAKLTQGGTSMFKYVCLAVALAFLPCGVYAQFDADKCTMGDALVAPKPEPNKKKDKKKSNEDNKMFLSRVVCEVEHALDTYQQSADVDEKHVLPALASVDFDFKTVVDTKGGFSINFLVFKFGSTYEKQDTNDVDFQYVPKSLVKGLEANRAKSLQQELIDTIKSAAQAIVEQSKLPAKGKDPLVFKQLSVTISYGVTWDINGGINAPIQLVTLGATLDHSKNNVQQVKLIFAPPPKRPTDEKKEE